VWNLRSNHRLLFSFSFDGGSNNRVIVVSDLILSFLLSFNLQRTADQKKEGNEAFSSAKFSAAISTYSRALHVRYCIDQM